MRPRIWSVAWERFLTDDFLHRHNALVFWALNATLLGLGKATPRA